MKRDLSLFIKDILENMERAEKFVTGMTFEKFATDEKTIFAVIRCLEIIGEATKQIPIELRQKYKNIPWRDMAGIRDKLIHAYFSINLELIWLAIKKDIPKIKPLIKQVLDDLQNHK